MFVFQFGEEGHSETIIVSSTQYLSAGAASWPLELSEIDLVYSFLDFIDDLIVCCNLCI